MPATEQTWRNSKTLHVIFGISSLGMLIATIAMLAGDNVREWKAYQRQFRDIETWVAESRITEEKTDQFSVEGTQVQTELNKVLRTPPDPAKVDVFVADAAEQAKPNRYDLAGLQKLAKQARSEGTDSEQQNHRTALIAAMDTILKRAKFLEDNAQRDLKFKRADLDVALSNYSIAVDEGKPQATLNTVQAGIDGIRRDVTTLNTAYEAARTHRLELQTALAAVTADEAAARKALADHKTDLKLLETALYERAPNGGKSFLELPIIDAFGRPLKVEQIWLPNLTLNNNFRDVARFDRCTTCHQGIDKSAPGSAIAPGYEQAHSIEIALATPKDPQDANSDGKKEDGPITISKLYGFTLAKQGIVNAADVAVEVVWPKTPGAQAGLKAGDVIERIGDVRILDHKRAETYLLRSVKWGQPLALVVRRGTPQPFSSHPRLDLFVGSLSPHKMGDVGCTICHEGQGSATQFKWVSHTPNDPTQAHQWSTKHGWFNNHHWIYPMHPERFAESSCLKCHHEVVELRSSERFPEPPAPKVVAGWEAIKDIGCFGCHEINGYDGPSKRRGPDLRAEPNYAAYAQQVLSDTTLSADQVRLAKEVVAHPDRSAPRKLLAEQLLASAGTLASTGTAEAKKLAPVTKKMAEMLGADDETPGKLRKVGPSLRYLGSKVDAPFIYDWVREPKNFRPSTKMPQFFGLHDHLPKGDKSEQLEPVEIRAITEYLVDASQKFNLIGPGHEAVEPASIERGKSAFQLRGCLACHKHADFPEAKQTHGPDLGQLGGKLSGDKGAKWLYSWLRDPINYHVRTSMPNVFLEPVKQADGKLVDPAADVVAYLLSHKKWTAPALPDVNATALDDLVQMYLKGPFTSGDAATFAKTGIPAERGANLAGDEARLVVGKGDLSKQKLLYVGKKSIARLGCAGCHDIPGFEDAKSIGTGLADWGRKEPSKLAFEQIVVYLQGKLSAHGSKMNDAHAKPDVAAHAVAGSEGGHGQHVDLEHMDPDQGFFLESLFGHHRDGFIWQKLREPRSYDYKKIENKDYLDRLRMPKFNLTDEQREQIITFVLGLVAEPPAGKYVYQAAPRNLAIQKGREVLERFNCVGCHTVDMETWEFDYDPSKLPSPQPFDPAKEYAFVQPHFTPAELAASKKVDRRGLGHAVVTGVPNPEVQEDQDTGKPFWFFKPWQPVAINGQIFRGGGQEVEIAEERITNKRPPYGGELSRLLHPVVLEREKKTNPNVKASDAWGWVPPPLLNEGIKVKPDWLYQFLLEPYPIRPAVVLRMPKFNLSAGDATALVDYFAAKDNAQYPYEHDARTWSDYVTPASDHQKVLDRLDGALKIVTDNNYCVKCHLVGDYVPPGALSAMAPQLDRIGDRLRPGFLQTWLASPPTLLPYTGMPINFPTDKPADQKLLAGSSEQQLQAVVDLLLNWSKLMKDQPSNSIKSRVKPPPATPPTANTAPVKTAPVAVNAGGAE